ncbi:class I SAM-dependent methyltransferase [Blastococcus haudaquaticus]|uniref:Methyltransferase domain-containing protein n=1 Tax=Blastococcus haudaquaticus TaxID=1938745 RepID=A0A286H391_9ACTN|nr:class I SAM-dependent methyltransferase [Blastococcus haudaquaticus]SOE02227.1 Methyltransferase domain-containing protein [Blastococcus haudaquaticus]
MSEHYEQMGEFHDLFMDDAWERLRPTLTEAFAQLDADATVLDLGAGSGVGTRVLAACTPARIIAVEPSRTMRAVLTARVVDDPDLSARVSIVADPLPQALADCPSPVAGFVCAHVLGHLGAADRRSTFGRIAGLLRPSATGVVTTAPVAGNPAAAVVEEARRIGDLTYVARHLPPHAGLAVSEYEVHRDGRLIRRERFTSTWSPPTDDQLRTELAAAGLALELAGPGQGLVRPAAGRAR